LENYLGLINHAGQLSLGIPPWVGRMSTGDGLLATIMEICVTVGPVTSTSGILAKSVKGTGCYLSLPSGRHGWYAGLIGFNPRQLKVLKRGISFHTMVIRL